MGPAAEPLPDPEPTDLPPPSPSRWRRALGRAARWGLMGFAAGLLLAVLFLAVQLWPYLRDDLVLDRVVLAVALDWRDFGQDKAQARLEYELDHQGIGLHVSDEDCTLSTTETLREVRCQWAIEVAFPFIEGSLPLEFESAAAIDAEGALRAAR